MTTPSVRSPHVVEHSAVVRHGVLLVVLGALVTGVSSTLMQLSATTPTTAAFYRCAYALPVLGALAVREVRRRGPLPRRELARATAAGVFLAVDLIVWYQAIGSLGAGLTTVVQDAQVIFVAAGAWLALGERPARRLLILVPVLLCGLILIAGAHSGRAAGADPVRGTFLALTSALAYAGFILLLRRTSGPGGGPSSFLLVATAATAATAAIVGGYEGSLHLAPTWPGAGWLVVLALGSQVIGWLVISTAMTSVSSLHASIALLLQPAAAVAYAWVILDDALTGTQLGGVFIIVLGVAAATAFDGRRRTRPMSSSDPSRDRARCVFIRARRHDRVRG